MKSSSASGKPFFIDLLDIFGVHANRLPDTSGQKNPHDSVIEVGSTPVSNKPQGPAIQVATTSPSISTDQWRPGFLVSLLARDEKVFPSRAPSLEVQEQRAPRQEHLYPWADKERFLAELPRIESEVVKGNSEGASGSPTPWTSKMHRSKRGWCTGGGQESDESAPVEVSTWEDSHSLKEA